LAKGERQLVRSDASWALCILTGKTQFLRQAGQSVPGVTSLSARKATAPGSAVQKLALSDTATLAAQEALALSVGPIAKILVRRVAAEAASIDEFCIRLGLHLARQEDRLALRKKVFAAAGL
jgi:hypothetical protein